MKKSTINTIKKWAKLIWDIPVVQSTLLTWLLRVGVPSGIAAVAMAIANTVSGNG